MSVAPNFLELLEDPSNMAAFKSIIEDCINFMESLGIDQVPSDFQKWDEHDFENIYMAIDFSQNDSSKDLIMGLVQKYQVYQEKNFSEYYAHSEQVNDLGPDPCLISGSDDDIPVLTENFDPPNYELDFIFFSIDWWNDETRTPCPYCKYGRSLEFCIAAGGNINELYTCTQFINKYGQDCYDREIKPHIP